MREEERSDAPAHRKRTVTDMDTNQLSFWSREDLGGGADRPGTPEVTEPARREPSAPATTHVPGQQELTGFEELQVGIHDS